MRRLLLFVGILCAIGLFVGFVGLVLIDFDFTKLDRMNYEERVYEITEDFDEIQVDLDTADVRFVLAEDGVCRVECMESEKLGYTVDAKDGVLRMEIKDNRKWYDYINLFQTTHPMTVYLPKSQYDHLSIDVSTGDVQVADGFSFGKVHVNGSTGDVSIGRVTVNSMDVKISTGDIILTGVRASVLELETSTGEISLSDVRTEETLSVETSTGNVNLTDVTSDGSISIDCTTGDVELNRCDAASIRIETTTGDIEGSLLTGKSFYTDTSTGDVNVPRHGSGGACDLITTTGDIHITIP